MTRLFLDSLGGPNVITSVLIRGRKRGVRVRVDMMTKAEVGVMQPQAKKRERPPGAGRCREWILLRTSRRTTALPNFDFSPARPILDF